LKREDLYHLIEYGAEQGLRMATIPAATDRLTESVITRLKAAGLRQMALSIDFPTAEKHDAFRGVPGAFDRTMRAVSWAHEHRLPLQVNTTLCAESLPYLEPMVELVNDLDIVFWEVFFLVPMGRGCGLEGLTAGQCEEAFEVLYKAQKEADFLVKVTEAPHFRRYVVCREWEATGRAAGSRVGDQDLPAQLVRTEGPGHTIGRASRGVNAGNGFLFVSHTGEVFPSGFLPLPAGDVRRQGLASIYRDSELFRKLRRPETFHGICGRCEFNRICGGSRSRAFALTGDYLGSDPWCAYRPGQHVAGGRTESL
ncbi:MAG: radical SAM/SPASM domain-containing protein, partial [Acidobacteriota bacterium]